MNLVSLEQARETFRGKRVAVVGGGPTAIENRPGFIDAHDVVVRVNNYKTGNEQGWRCDVFYSFFGSSIRKTAGDLERDGVRLCWAKCPDGKPLDSAWHERQGKTNGIDFRYIYRERAAWWFCDTFIPEPDHFLRGVKLLGGHVPTTGFSAILDVLESGPAAVYLTGFDFFTSGQHNVDERWKPGDPTDPIRHRPDLERRWIHENWIKHPVYPDRALEAMIA